MLTIARVPNDPHNLSYWLFFIQGGLRHEMSCPGMHASGSQSAVPRVRFQGLRLVDTVARAVGMGMLFPWNSFINAGPYFKDKLASTPYAQFIENDFELTFQVSHLVVLMLSVRYQHLFSTFSRTIYPLYGQVLHVKATSGDDADPWVQALRCRGRRCSAGAKAKGRMRATIASGRVPSSRFL